MKLWEDPKSLGSPDARTIVPRKPLLNIVGPLVIGKCPRIIGRSQLMPDCRMELLVLITFGRSLAEWDSPIRRLWPCPELTTWVDVTLIGVDLMGKLQ